MLIKLITWLLLVPAVILSSPFWIALVLGALVTYALS